MENKSSKKRLIILFVVLVVLILAILLLVIHPWKKDTKPKEQKIEPALEDYGTSDFSISEFKKNTEGTTLYEDQYPLSDQAWQLNLIPGEQYSELKTELSNRMETSLASDDEFVLESESLGSVGEEVIIYKYKGVNLFMFQFDVGNLSAKIQNEIAATLDINTLNKEQMIDYFGRCYMKAIDVILHYADQYKEEEERDITIIKKNGEIVNGDSVYNELIGMNSPRVVEPGQSTYGQAFINQSNIRLEQIYQDAIKKGYYDPSNPLDFD